ncbi:MAG: HAMP domain-containing histidine kinase [Clostridia bacterium]|nr:HAMP domain-containing histidine kinase [Clostridia bacterium]
MKKSFRFKVLGVFLTGIILSMFALTFLSNVLLRPVFIQNSKNTMEKYASEIKICLSNTPDKTESLLEEINTSYGITTHVTDKNGRVVYSYTKLKINRLNSVKYKKWIESYKLRDDKEGLYFKQRTDESDMIKKIVYISDADNDKYIIMNKSIKGIDQDTRIVTIFILITGFTLAFLGTAVWGLFTKNFTDNIKKMSDITRKMSELDFSEKINLHADDEVGVLARSIDMLSGELESSIDGLKEDVDRQKRLIRDISHELKTPVTTVKGYLENIEALSDGNKLLEKYCKIAVEECDDIDNLIEEMLEMSRLESQGYVCDMEKIPVGLIEENIKGKLSAEFNSHRFNLSFEKSELLCNLVLVTRAVMNYVKNAVKYGDGKSVIEITGTASKDGYVFAVSNTGKAISDEEKENIWDLFYKNDKSRQRNESHGIGLSMVRQIAVLHNGSVNLESKDGKNIFSIVIPF